MKPQPYLFSAAFLFLCLGAFSVYAEEFFWAQGLTPQQILNEMVASGKYRPQQTATIETFEMPLVLDGKLSGSVTVKAGTALNVVDVKPDGVTVELHGNQTRLPIAKTDLIARYVDRKKEVDQQQEKDRQDLITAGKETLVLPTPPPIQIVEPVTKIVYVDNSQPRINVNAGNYWPYTGGYYPYANSYVLPYYQPVYYQTSPFCYPANRPSGQPVVAATSIRPAVVPVVVHPFAPARPGN